GIRDGHVTGVQTCALPIYAVDFHRRRVVDEIEQRGECVAQADAAPAAVADVENALEFLLEHARVVERGVAPGERMAGRCVQPAQIGRASCRERGEGWGGGV